MGGYTVSLTAEGSGGSDTLTRTHYLTVSAGIGYTTTRVITYTYECAACLERSGRDKLYRLTGASYSTGERFEYERRRGQSHLRCAAWDEPHLRCTARGRLPGLALTRTLGVSQTVDSYQYDQANRTFRAIASYEFCPTVAANRASFRDFSTVHFH